MSDIVYFQAAKAVQAVHNTLHHESSVMQRIINYPKNSRVVVSAPKGPGQHNFAFDDIGKTCSLCGKDFDRVWNLRRHLTKYHKLATHIANDISPQYADRNLASQSQTTNTAEPTAPDHNDDSVNEDLHVESDLEDDDSSDVDDINSDGDDNVSEIELDAGESIIEMDEDTSPFESPSPGNHLYMHIRNSMLSSASNTSSSLDADLDLLREATGSHTTWNQYTSDTHPFPDLQSMVLLVFVDGDKDMVSRRILKKILFTISLVLKLHEEAIRKKSPFKLPRLDALLNYQTRKKSKIPLPENNTTSAYINLPSDHVRFLAANPKKARNMFSLPDRTPNHSICLQQGEKWRTHWYYQQPMFTHNGVDFWSGDIVNFMNGSTPARFLVESFHTMDNSAVFVQGYMVYILEGGQFIGIEVESTNIKLETLLGVDSTPVDVALCYSVSPGKVFHLIPRHKSLLEEPHFLKRHVLDETGKPIDPKLFYKVRISPIILFTDDTSGNRSKQYNPYESWSMKFAALSYEERSSIENIHFLSAIPKKKGASGMSLLPKIVEDFKRLENGLVMFSAKDNENVLVASPLLWIEADTPCHSELCGLRAPTSLYPCRKCYVRLQRSMPNLQSSSYYTGRHTARTKAHYLAAASTSGRGSTIPDAPLTGNALTASDLCFANRATDALLELQSFDPSTDTPVEVLHNILLGVAKYLVNDLVKVVLKKNPNQMARLSKALNDYETLKECQESSLEITEFANDSILSLITPPFVRLGRLCSLVFVRAVRYDYNMYIDEVEKAVTSLIQELHHYVITCEIEGHNPYSSKPKVHLLTHLPDDLRRFGTALHYETEKGEQFNKHIREHLMHTNRLNTSRDVCLKFAKQSAMRHIIDGGSWVSKDKMREKYGNSTAEFLKENFNDNVKNILFSGSRDFADNNDTDDITAKALCDNTFAVFMLKESRDQHAHPFIGKVSSLRVEHYRVESSPTLKLTTTSSRKRFPMMHLLHSIS
ncbi:hypothetical protein J3Q64DRAFT_1847691 [Phycomyces blakesleeanus]|uniref:C2H2-type domain-containing protein n=1 Tax=Phycomyces blakesleeanus TaxID=4837 RepID=A0ABR3B1A0_PHYBL